MNLNEKKERKESGKDKKTTMDKEIESYKKINEEKDIKEKEEEDIEWIKILETVLENFSSGTYN